MPHRRTHTDDIESVIRENLPRFAPLNATVKLDMGRDGVLFLDAKRNKPTLSRDDAEANCTLGISAQNMRKLLAGRMNPLLAITLGKIRISGDTKVAKKLGQILSD